MQQYSTALTNLQKNTGIIINPEAAGVIDFAAKGKITQEDLAKALNAGIAPTAVAGVDVDGSVALVYAVQRLSQELQKSNDIMSSYNNLIDSFNGARGIYQQIENAIVDKGGNLLENLNTRSEVIKEVVQNILNSPNGSEWNVTTSGNIQKIDGIDDIYNKWLVLLYGVTSGVVPKDDEAIKQAILDNIKASANNLKGVALEVGTLYTGEMASKIIANQINDLNQEIEHSIKTQVSGNNAIGCTVEMRADEAMTRLISQSITDTDFRMASSKGGYVTMTFPSKSMKADQRIWSDTMGINYDNISVKATTAIKTVGKSKSKRVSEIKLQSSSPMLYVLMREIGLDGYDIAGVLQIGLAKTGKQPDVLWNRLKTFVGVSMLVPALTGLNKESDGINLVTKVRINEYLIPMPQLLNYVQARFANSARLNGESFTGSVDLKHFPARSKFTALNEWVGSKGQNNAKEAKERSAQASSAGMSLLYNTKLELRFKNLNLSMLMKSGAVI